MMTWDEKIQALKDAMGIDKRDSAKTVLEHLESANFTITKKS